MILIPYFKSPVSVCWISRKKLFAFPSTRSVKNQSLNIHIHTHIIFYLVWFESLYHHSSKVTGWVSLNFHFLVCNMGISLIVKLFWGLKWNIKYNGWHEVCLQQMLVPLFLWVSFCVFYVCFINVLINIKGWCDWPIVIQR